MRQNVAKIENQTDRYIEGFLAGQAVAYCEMVRRGVRLAGQLDVPADECARLLMVVQREGCLGHSVQRDEGRAAVWIYRDERIKRLIDSFETAAPCPSHSAIWGMGKLFGYGDQDILDYLPS